MKRKIYDAMLKWKETSAGKTCLLIDGARRVGKSYIAEQFAKDNYRSYLMLDFNRADKDVISLFDRYMNDLDGFYMYLSAIYGVKLYKHESVIVFDEVQLCPKARGAVKYLIQDGRYHFIETGSLLSIRENVSDIIIPSEERHLKLCPMDFEEFLWAMGEESLIKLLKEKFITKTQLGEALHRKVMTLFRQYLIIGGMPQAVAEYTENREFENADAIKRDILALYRADLAKHAGSCSRNVTAIFDEIPAQLSKHEKKFTLSALGKGLKYRNYEDSFLWLEDSMIVNICYKAAEPSVGLKMNRDRTTLKMYMGDTGLLISHAFDENALASEEIYKRLLLGKLDFNEGMFFENIVAQMLSAAGHKLYFYSNSSRQDKNSRMEIDFLLAKSKITNAHNISPVEVKSGKNYTYVSLGKFRTKFAQQLHTPYLLHTGDVAEKDGIIHLPVYMTGLL